MHQYYSASFYVFVFFPCFFCYLRLFVNHCMIYFSTCVCVVACIWVRGGVHRKIRRRTKNTNVSGEERAGDIQRDSDAFNGLLQVRERRSFLSPPWQESCGHWLQEIRHWFGFRVCYSQSRYIYYIFSFFHKNLWLIIT